MMAPESFELHIADGIAQIVLSRPEAYNALTFDVYRELNQCFIELQTEDSVRVVILSGRGKAFCSGGDVRNIIGSLLAADAAELLQFTRMTCELVWNMRSLLKPIIACLNGVTAGAGAILAMSSDFRIAAEGARIAFLFVRVGLSGADMGACYILPKIVGLTKATELLMTGDFISAEEAYRIGLYHRVVPTDQLSDITAELATRLAAGPANGLAVTKQQLNSESLPRLKEVLEAEATAQAKCMLHPDFKEGYDAFMQKRTPKFL
ncbi:enoyl-CoA hydratase family protein [bacterium]|nr:enoyl-CoA hydratase family protein [bacterium]